MLLEAALCLALQGAELKDKGMAQGGVLTPAVSMGAVLTQRLKAADITFEITKTGKETPKSPLDKLKSAQGSANKATAVSLAPGGSSAGGANRMPAELPRLRGGLQRWREHGGLDVLAEAGWAHAHPVAHVARRACAPQVARAQRCAQRSRVCVHVALSNASEMAGGLLDAAAAAPRACALHLGALRRDLLHAPALAGDSVSRRGVRLASIGENHPPDGLRPLLAAL